MKLILFALAALLVLVAPGMAMTGTQAAYLEGFRDGLEMMNLYRENATAYNEEAAKFNASLSALNETEAAAFMLPLAAERVSPVPAIFDASVPIEELKK